MSRSVVEWVQVRAEIVHAAPEPGLTFCPCCDKTPVEFDCNDRVSQDPDEVTCGRLSAVDERLLMESSGN